MNIRSALTTLALALRIGVRARTLDTLGANVTLRTSWIQDIITAAGSGALLELYNGTRPATGAAITTQTKLATLVGGANIGTATSGVLDWAESGFTQNNTLHVNGTPTWFRLKSSGGTFVMDGSIPGDATFSGNVVNGTDIVFGTSTTTAPAA